MPEEEKRPPEQAHQRQLGQSNAVVFVEGGLTEPEHEERWMFALLQVPDLEVADAIAAALRRTKGVPRGESDAWQDFYSRPASALTSDEAIELRLLKAGRYNEEWLRETLAYAKGVAEDLTSQEDASESPENGPTIGRPAATAERVRTADGERQPRGGESTATPTIARDELNDAERNVVDALGLATMTGEALAEAAGYPFNSNFKATLSSLRKRKVLGNRSPGYFLEPACQHLVEQGQDKGQDKGQD